MKARKIKICPDFLRTSNGFLMSDQLNSSLTNLLTGENCHYRCSTRLLCQHIRYRFTIRARKTNRSSEDWGPVTSRLCSLNSTKTLVGVRWLSLLYLLNKIENGDQTGNSNRSLFFCNTVILLWKISSGTSHFQSWHEFTARTVSEEPLTNGTKGRLRTARFLSSCKFIINLMNTSRFPERTGISW